MSYHLSTLAFFVYYGIFTCFAANITAPTVYTIGDPLYITWDQGSFSQDTVSIYLQYEKENVEKILYFSTNANNTGSANFTFDYSNDTSHFLVPHNTTGNFVVRTNKTILTSEDADIYQPIYMTTALGAIYPNTTSRTIKATVYVKTSIVNQMGGVNSLMFDASFININNGTFEKMESLQATYLPTPSPTLSPTVSPTPAPVASPTPSPSPFPTSGPTPAPTAPTSPPTPKPTSPPTASSSPTSSPTQLPTLLPTPRPSVAPTPVPTLKPTTAPTPVPTLKPTTVPTPVPTLKPTTAPTSPTLKPTAAPTLPPTLKPTVGPTPFPTSKPTSRPTLSPTPSPTPSPSPFPSLRPTARPTAEPTTRTPTYSPTTAAPTFAPTTNPPTRAPTSPTPVPTLPTAAPTSRPIPIERRLLNDDDESYTNFTVTIVVIGANGATPGGPYILSIGLNNTNMTQYYTLNNAEDDPTDTMYQFVIYDPNNLNLSLSYNNTDDITDFNYYQNVKYNLNISDELKDLSLYIVVYDVYLNNYATSCMPYSGSEWKDHGKFGWKFQHEYDNSTIPPGTYDWKVYWAATDDFTVLEANEAQYRIFMNGLPQAVIHEYKNDSNISSTYPAVVIVDTDDDDDEELTVDKNKKYTWDFTTSYAIGEQIYFYFIQNGANVNTRYNFTYTNEPTEVAFTTPDSLTIDENTDNTYVYVYTYECDGETEMGTYINVKTKEHKKDKDSGLSAGAIVGIVVAGVVVIGIAAWWLCMRKSSSDSKYHQLE